MERSHKPRLRAPSRRATDRALRLSGAGLIVAAFTLARHLLKAQPQTLPTPGEILIAAVALAGTSAGAALLSLGCALFAPYPLRTRFARFSGGDGLAEWRAAQAAAQASANNLSRSRGKSARP